MTTTPKPNEIAEFLVSRGYKLHGGRPGVVDVYVNGERCFVLLPTDQDDKDYDRHVKDLLGFFATDDTSVDEIIKMIKKTPQ